MRRRQTLGPRSRRHARCRHLQSFAKGQCTAGTAHVAAVPRRTPSACHKLSVHAVSRCFAPSLPSANVRRRRRSLRVGEWCVSDRCARVHVCTCVHACVLCVRTCVRACIACMLAVSRAPRRAERPNRYPPFLSLPFLFRLSPFPPSYHILRLSLSPNLPLRLGTLGRSNRGARDKLFVTVAERRPSSATWNNPPRCSTAYRTSAC